MAIAADGRFCGYVSGGCVEAAVAAEALLAMSTGRDRCLRLGEGSPFFDIVLPCGGGITVTIHLLRNVLGLERVIRELEMRRFAALEYSLADQTLSFSDKVPKRGLWSGSKFITPYRPRTRLIVSGHPAEVRAVSALAKSSGFELIAFTHSGARNATLGLIDAFSAVVLLHHDLDSEAPLLEPALQSEAFYIGALGSTRTHTSRMERLRKNGMPQEAIDRVRAPIGMFGPTRDSNSLAISVLADVAAARLVAYT